MASELTRAFGYATRFYLERLRLILLFSIPFIAAFLIPVLVPAPTYLALGGVFLRTGSFPELGILGLFVAIAGYAVALFLIADTIVNINLVVRSKRTLTQIKSEVLAPLAVAIRDHAEGSELGPHHRLTAADHERTKDTEGLLGQHARSLALEPDSSTTIVRVSPMSIVWSDAATR